MANWVIEGVLATSPRPGYRPGPEHTVTESELTSWIDGVRELGIRSVICLIDADQLWLYRKATPEGLIAWYEGAGLEVAHIPAVDQQTHPFSPAEYDAAWRAFEALPHPVLVHCSAGMDRTGRVVAHILRQLEGGTQAAT